MQLTIYAAVANAAARMSPGRERRALEAAADFLDFRQSVGDSLKEAGAVMLEIEDEESEARIGHICPHCKREPMQVAMHGTQFGPIPAMIFSCAGCRKVIGVCPVPITMPQERPSMDQESSLIVPGRRM